MVEIVRDNRVIYIPVVYDNFGENYFLNRLAIADESSYGWDTPSQHWRLALYDDDGGEPGALVKADYHNDGVAAGRKHGDNTQDTQLTNGNTYWVAVRFDDCLCLATSAAQPAGSTEPHFRYHTGAKWGDRWPEKAQKTTDGGAYAYAALYIISAQSNTFWVDGDTGSNSNPGTEALPWETINFAESQVANGDTIRVRSASSPYMGSFTTGVNNVIICADDPDDPPVIGSDEWFINHDLWALDGLIFDGWVGLPAIIIGNAGSVDDVRISNCVFRHSTDLAIRVEHADRLVIEDSKFRNIRSRVDGDDKNAVQIEDTVGDVTIRRCEFEDIGSDGIHLFPGLPYSTGEILIEDCTFRINRPYGSRSWQDFSTNCGENGIDIKGATTGKVTVRRCSFHGFRATVAGQDASGSDGEGLYIHDGSNNVHVEDCRFFDCDIGIDLSPGSPDHCGAVIRNCVFHDIDVYAIQVRTASDGLIIEHCTSVVTGSTYNISVQNSDIVSVRDNYFQGGLTERNSGNTNEDQFDYNGWYNVTPPAQWVGTNDPTITSPLLNNILEPQQGSDLLSSGTNMATARDQKWKLRSILPAIGAYEQEVVTSFLEFFDGRSLSLDEFDSITDAEGEIFIVPSEQSNRWLMAIHIEDTTPHFATWSFGGPKRLRLRFCITPALLAMANGDAFRVIKVDDGGTSVVSIDLRYSSGYYIRANANDDLAGTNWVGDANGFALGDNERHLIEIDILCAASPGDDDGYLQLWIDGVSQGTASGLDNDTFTIDGVDVGAVSGVDAGTGGDDEDGLFYLDSISLNNDGTEIGEKDLDRPSLPQTYEDDARIQAYYKLDEANGDREDVSPNGNDLSEVNTVAYSTQGRAGTGAADFERDNDEYLVITDAAQTGLDITGDITIIARVRPESAPGWMYIAAKYDTASNDRAYAIMMTLAERISFNISNDGTAFQQSIGISAVATDGATFSHLAGAYDGEWQWVFKDGTQDRGLDGGNPNATAIAIHNSDADFAVGASSIPGSHFDGVIDYVVVFNAALSAAEIEGIYRYGIISAAATSTSTSTSITVSTSTSATESTSTSVSVTQSTSTSTTITIACDNWQEPATLANYTNTKPHQDGYVLFIPVYYDMFDADYFADQIRVWIEDNAEGLDIKLGIYDDDSGVPGNLIYGGLAVAGGSTNYVTEDIPDFQLSDGDLYWVGLRFETEVADFATLLESTTAPTGSNEPRCRWTDNASVAWAAAWPDPAPTTYLLESNQYLYGAIYVACQSTSTSTSVTESTSTSTTMTVACDDWVCNAAYGDHGETQALNPSVTYFQPVAATATGYVTELRIYAETFAHQEPIRLGLYANLAGDQPGALLAQATATVTGVGYVAATLPMSSVYVTTWENYWVGAQVPVGSFSVTVDSDAPYAGSAARYALTEYAAGMPDPAGTTYSLNISVHACMYVACSPATSTSTSTSITESTSTSSSVSLTVSTSSSTSSSTSLTRSTSTSVTLTSTSSSSSSTSVSVTVSTSSSTSTTTLTPIPRERRPTMRPVLYTVNQAGRMFRHPRAYGRKWSSYYGDQGGGFGYLTWSEDRDIGLDHPDIDFSFQVMLIKGISQDLFDGSICAIEEEQSDDKTTLTITALGWVSETEDDRYNKVFCDARPGEWESTEVESGSLQPGKFNVTTSDGQIYLEPRRSIDFLTDEYARSRYTFPFGGTAIRLAFDYDLALPFTWPGKLEVRDDNGVLWSATVTGTGSVDVAASSGATYFEVRFYCTDDGENTAVDDTVYGKLTSAIAYGHDATSGELTARDVAIDLVDFISGDHSLSSDTTKITATGRELPATVAFEGDKSPREILEWCCSFGGVNDTLLAWGVELNRLRRLYLEAQDLDTIHYLVQRQSGLEAQVKGDYKRSAQKLYAVYTDENNQVQRTSDLEDQSIIDELGGNFRRQAYSLDGAMSETSALQILRMALEKMKRPQVTTSFSVKDYVYTHTLRQLPLDEVQAGGIVIVSDFRGREATMSETDYRTQWSSFQLVGVEINEDAGSARLIPAGDRREFEQFLTRMAAMRD